MKDCEKLEMYSAEKRKAHIDNHNRLLQKKLATPEPSLLSSSLFSHDMSLNSISSKTDLDDPKDTAFHNFSSRSRKPSQVLHECLSCQISEKDRKILRLMAQRRESKMEESEVAFLARSVWEEERAQEAKRAEKTKASFMELLAKKREMEELEKAARRDNRKENQRQEKMILEMKFLEKHDKVERRQKELCQRQRLKAETTTTKHQLLVHQELRKQKQEEEEMEKALHVRQFEAKGRRTEEKLRCAFMERIRKLKEESLKQELRWQAAKNVRDELNRRWEEERISRLELSERNQMIRKERVSWAKEWKRKIVSEKNERDRQLHAVIYSRVKEEEKERVNRMRRKIQAKDLKSKVFREKREETISKSRCNARTAAELRQKIRLTYNL